MNQQYLSELLKAGDVYDSKKEADKTGLVVVRNKKIVRIFLQRQVIKFSFYRTFLKTMLEYDNLVKADVPQLYFSIAKDETFAKQLDEFYTSNPDLKNIAGLYRRGRDLRPDHQHVASHFIDWFVVCNDDA